MGRIVHHPKHMSARRLQWEVVTASRLIYSPRNLVRALVRKRGLERLLFVGEFLWQMSERADMIAELRSDHSVLDD